MSKINFNNFFLERDKLDINWEYVWELPYFREMEKTQQNPRWHMEGNVMQHTRLVCENMMKQLINDERCVRYSFYQKKLLMLAALFHDIGKPQTTFLGEKDGNWHSYGHDVVGAKLAREMLWDWPLYEREFICSMIKHHMEPLFVHKSNNVEKRIKEITSVVPYFDLYLLGERAGAQFAQSEHVYFIQDQTVFKGVARYDGQPVIAEAFAAIGVNGTTPNSTMTFAADKANVVDLASITGLTLSPSFAAGTTTYTATTTNAKDAVTAIAKSSDASVKVFYTTGTTTTEVLNGAQIAWTAGADMLTFVSCLPRILIRLPILLVSK